MFSRPLSAVAVLAILLTPVATAPPAAAQASDDGPQLLILVDSSAAMRRSNHQGSRKLDAARTALQAVIPRLPSSGDVGLRVSGGDATANQARACDASSLRVPLDGVDRPALRDAVSTLQAYGENPLAFSLDEASRDFRNRGRRTILLISGGRDTCDPDPCFTVRQIGRDTGVRIDVVGFRTNAQARRHLQCIAHAGGGTYYQADDAVNLTVALQRMTVRAFRPSRLSGRLVNGGPTRKTAPQISAGQYVEELTDGRPRYYRLRRQIKGSTLYVGVSERPPSGTATPSFTLQVATRRGAPCGKSRTTTMYDNASPVVTASVSTDDPTAARACTTSSDIFVRLRRSPRAAPGPGNPLELVVIEEPPVADDLLQPPASTRPDWVDPRNSLARPVVAGASFSDAPQVFPGRYQTTLFPGEVEFFKVRLQWGQRLQVAARASQPSRRARFTDDLQKLEVALLNPSRADARAPIGDAGPYRVNLDGRDVVARATTVEVRHANRTGSSNAQRNVAMPGDYYVAIGLDADRENQSYLVPVEIVIATVGGSDQTPRYVEEAAILVPAADGRAVKFKPTTSAGGASSAAVAGADPVAEAGVLPTEDQAAPAEPERRLTLVHVAAIIALCVVVLGLLTAPLVPAVRARVSTRP